MSGSAVSKPKDLLREHHKRANTRLEGHLVASLRLATTIKFVTQIVTTVANLRQSS
jgi:hypothetical protein